MVARHSHGPVGPPARRYRTPDRRPTRAASRTCCSFTRASLASIPATDSPSGPRPPDVGGPMRTPLSTALGIDFPLFAFSHCRDVVAAVSRAGGLGVLGALYFTPEELETELRWIDEHVDGRPYGVDVVMPASLSTTVGDVA